MTAKQATDGTILVVDDEPGIRELLTAWLADEYDLRVAVSAKEGREHLDRDVDLALIDRRMPGVSGDELLDRVREAGHEFPVAMITAVTPELDILDMPFDDYIVKPIEKEELLRKVELLLKRSEFDERSRRLFRLAAKRGTLRASEEVEHYASEEYQQITEEIEEIRADLEDVLAEITESDPLLAYQRL